MSCSEEEVPELNAELYPPITDADHVAILENRLNHEEELEMEGATTYDVNVGRADGKWHNTSGRSKEELRNLSETNDSGNLTISPCVHTNYIEFQLEEPDGAAKECNCNSCWGRFWIAPFSEPAECPFCHEPGFNIATRRVIGGE